MAGLTDAQVALLRGENFAVVATLTHRYNGIDFHTPENRVIVKVKPERIFDYNVA